MKKVVGILMFVIIVMTVIAGIAEPATTWSEADAIIVEYAENNGYNKWTGSEGYIDVKNEIQCFVGTVQKNYVLESYGFDFDNESLEKFCEIYRNAICDQFGFDSDDVQVAMCKTDEYKENDIYELMIISNGNLTPDSDNKITMVRVLFVVY